MHGVLLATLATQKQVILQRQDKAAATFSITCDNCR